jgi:hypothetical protein
MISHEQLQHLLDVRRGLLRELGRLDLAILNLTGQECLANLLDRGVMPRRATLTWEDALHEAKVPLFRTSTTKAA